MILVLYVVLIEVSLVETTSIYTIIIKFSLDHSAIWADNFIEDKTNVFCTRPCEMFNIEMLYNFNVEKPKKYLTKKCIEKSLIIELPSCK